MRVPITVLASGFASLEGPAVDDAGGLYFSDLRDGGVYRLRPDGGTDVVLSERAGVGGIVLHSSGGLVVSGPSIAHVHDHETRVLLDLGDIGDRDGNVAVGFNDLAADSRGRVLAGVLREDAHGAPVPGELVRVDGVHHHEVLHDDIHPNGIAFSPAGERLYAADTFRRRIVVFDVAYDDVVPVSAFSTGEVPGFPDGLATDEEGGIWVAFYRGSRIARFAPDGAVLEVIEMPVLKPLSLCFAGPRRADLFVVTGRSEPGAPDTGSVYSVEVGVRGASVHAVTLTSSS